MDSGTLAGARPGLRERRQGVVKGRFVGYSKQLPTQVYSIQDTAYTAYRIQETEDTEDPGYSSQFILFAAW